MRIKLLTLPNQKDEFLTINEENKPVNLYMVKNVMYINGLLYDEMHVSVHERQYRYLMNRVTTKYIDIDQYEKIHITEPVLALVYAWMNVYSHFILNCLPALFLSKYYGIFSNNIIVFAPNKYKFQKQLFELLGVSDDQILEPEQNKLYFFDKVIYADTYSSEIKDPIVADLYEKFAQPYQLNRTPNIYITRINNKNRQISNSSEVIDFFRKRNYEIVDFDNLSIKEQLAYINSAQTICAEHGSSGANLLFRNKKQFSFCELFSSNRITHLHTSILLFKNCKYSATVNSAELINSSHNKDVKYQIDLNLLSEALVKPAYQFNYRSSSSIQIKLNEANDKLRSYLDYDAKCYVDAKHAYAIGDFKNALKAMQCLKLHSCDSNYISFYLTLSLLNGELSDFLAISKYIELNIFEMANLNLINNQLKISNIQYASALMSRLYRLVDISYIEQLKKDIIFINSLTRDSIFTWHNNIICFDNNSQRLIQSKESSSNLSFNYSNDKISIFCKTNNSFINSIDLEGNVTFSSEPYYFVLLKHNNLNFSIVYRDRFMSALKNGFFTFVDHSREWERFFIKKDICYLI